MDFKKLEKAHKIYQEIKTLDAEIIEIEKYAMLVANGEISIELNLGITDLKEKEEKESKVRFDEDGSLIQPSSFEEMMRHSMSRIISPFGMSYGSGWKKEEKKNEYRATLSENAALQIFGILLCEKQTKRQGLLNRLNKLEVVK